MNAELERRYRRLLRLLPAGYRRAWEEDMVTAFLQSAEGRGITRPPLGERLSVIALAFRLRLAGQHEPPRGKAWHHAAYALALILLLYQAVIATVILVDLAGRALWRPMERPLSNVSEWSTVLYWLLWIAAYASLVLGWIVALRIAVITVVALFAGAVVVSGSHQPADLIALTLTSAWMLLILAVPNDARPRRIVWLGAYLGSALVLGPAALSAARPGSSGSLGVDLGLFWRLALLVGTVVALAIPTLRRSPGWLLAIAGVTVTLTGESLLSQHVAFHSLILGTSPAAMGVDLVLLSLGVACAIVGIVTLRRLPRTEPEPA